MLSFNTANSLSPQMSRVSFYGEVKFKGRRTISVLEESQTRLVRLSQSGQFVQDGVLFRIGKRYSPYVVRFMDELRWLLLGR